MRGKMRRPSGAWAIPSRMISKVGSARDVAPVEHDPAARRARPAADRHQQRRFAGAVGADQRDDLAGADLEIDALQRLDIAVEGMDAADGQHRAPDGSHPSLSTAVR